MKRLQVQRWTGQLLAPKSRHPLQLERYQKSVRTRSKSTSTAIGTSLHDQNAEQLKLANLPSPYPGAALSSAKLAALHARLSLPKELPLQTLSRTLVDSSADSSENFNNLSLSKIGSALLSYQVTEWLLCTYPRLPMALFFAAMKAYIGPATLHKIGIEWGVETAAAPGGEVDPGLLQFSKLRPGQRPILGESERNDEKSFYRRGMSSRVIYDDEFGDLVYSPQKGDVPQPTEQAYSSFVRALVGSIYAHSGRRAANDFIKAHILSRHLEIHKLFEFKHPMRDLIKLCAREGFQHPIARLLSETGRCSNAAVFVVGIYSGIEKLGEGAGPSLTEARTRAAIAALKAWYLYTPNIGETGCLPSDMEDGSEKGREWEPIHIDPGEVV
jgi:dsRNA-specific ribonuclease